MYYLLPVVSPKSTHFVNVLVRFWLEPVLAIVHVGPILKKQTTDNVSFENSKVLVCSIYMHRMTVKDRILFTIMRIAWPSSGPKKSVQMLFWYTLWLSGTFFFFGALKRTLFFEASVLGLEVLIFAELFWLVHAWTYGHDLECTQIEKAQV